MKIQKKIYERAFYFLKQKFLKVHYYRIRKQLAYSLPVKGPLSDSYSVRNFSSSYPWLIWLMWNLEERILTLGEYVCTIEDQAVRTAVDADLLALADWETYRESKRPDLSYAHAVRVLWVAFTRWSWVREDLRIILCDALLRAVDDALAFSKKLHGQFDSVQSLLSEPTPHQHLHNIPLIGTCAMAVAAKAVAHPAASELNSRVTHLFSALLSLRTEGFTEGASYDGYVLSFVADWLSTLTPSERDVVMAHPGFAGMVEQVIELAVPGDVMETAPLGDVEPVEMPFVWSALAKLQVFRPNSRVTWALSQCDIARLRIDALVALAHLPVTGTEVPCVQSPKKLNYALVLRTGYEADDVAVAMGLSSSPMGHIQCDNGSLVLGTRGRWWLDDPGYQQYLQTSERKFTVGPSAHNALVINGYAQVRKQPELIASKRLEDMPDVQFALVDLTACYPAMAGAKRIRRAVWLVGKQHLVVCDEVAPMARAAVAYHWHGHPSLYWCVQDGLATLVSENDPGCHLHIFSPQITLAPDDLHRLPGSRGHQTLTATVFLTSETTIWWVFSFDEEPPAFRMADKVFFVGDRAVPLEECVKRVEMRPLLRTDPLVVTATRKGDTVIGRCEVGAGYFQGELEYAFYLMVAGKKDRVQWYTSSHEVIFSIPDNVGQKKMEIYGFVREVKNPDKKLSLRVEVLGHSAL